MTPGPFPNFVIDGFQRSLCNGSAHVSQSETQKVKPLPNETLKVFSSSVPTSKSPEHGSGMVQRLCRSSRFDRGSGITSFRHTGQIGTPFLVNALSRMVKYTLLSKD